MKKVLVIIALLVSVSAHSALPNKMFGVSLGDNMATAIATIKKIGTVVSSDTSSCMFKGVPAFGKSCIFVLQFYKRKVVALGLIVPGSYTGYVDSFNSVYNAMYKKYGKASKEVREFTSPYSAGDGYTATGIRVGRVTISNTWGDNTDKCFAMLQIMRSLATMLVYYDSAGYAALSAETDRKQSSGI